MPLEVSLSEIIVTEVAGEQFVSFCSVFYQEPVGGEILFALVAAEDVMLVHIVLLLLRRGLEDFVTKLAMKQSMDDDLMN